MFASCDDNRTEFVNASMAYKEYGIPRSALRELSSQNVIEKREKRLYGEKIMKLYSRSDIEKYINEQ